MGYDADCEESSADADGGRLQEDIHRSRRRPRSRVQRVTRRFDADRRDSNADAEASTMQTDARSEKTCHVVFQVATPMRRRLRTALLEQLHDPTEPQTTVSQAENCTVRTNEALGN